jgi:hypothetical protein
MIGYIAWQTISRLFLDPGLAPNLSVAGSIPRKKESIKLAGISLGFKPKGRA